MTHPLAKGALIALGCLLLVVALVVGMMNGWIDFQGRPMQKIRELQPHVDERNRQIDDLANP